MAKTPAISLVAPVAPVAPVENAAPVAPVAPVNPYAGMTLEQAIAANYARMKAEKGIVTKAKSAASSEPVDPVEAGKRAAATYAERLKAAQLKAFQEGTPLPLSAAEKAVATRHDRMVAAIAAKAAAKAKAESPATE